MNPWKGKVLNLFGLAVGPANWIIFAFGFLLFVAAPFLLFTNIAGNWLAVVILCVQGIQLAVEGYGAIKDDSPELPD